MTKTHQIDVKIMITKHKITLKIVIKL